MSELPEIVKIMLSSGNEDDTSIKADPNIETKDKIKYEKMLSVGSRFKNVGKDSE